MNREDHSGQRPLLTPGEMDEALLRESLDENYLANILRANIQTQEVLAFGKKKKKATGMYQLKI